MVTKKESMASKSELYLITLILVLALALLVADRILRIEPFCKGSDAPARCGVGFPPCEHPLRCINGKCASTEIPFLKKTDLPVVP